MPRLAVRFSVLVAACALASGCSDDEPASPVPVADTGAPATTETSLDSGPVFATPIALGGADSGVDMTTVQDQLPAATPRRDLPSRIDDLAIFSEKALDLADGRTLVLGRWDGDETIETSSAMRLGADFPEPTIRSVVPIRLFVVDWETERIGVISAQPDTHDFSNATGDFHFAEVVLEFELEPDGTHVRYTAGWNGAAYDFPYSLWTAEIPATS